MMSLILDIDYKFKKGRKKYALLITICLVTSTVHPTLWAFHTYIYIHIHIYILYIYIYILYIYIYILYIY